MAVAPRKAAVVKYKVADEQLQTGFGGVYNNLDKAMELFRPSLADSQKIGFFSQDRSSQTEVTEIINLKEMTTVLRNVLGDVGVLRREITLSKQIIQADYDAKLKNKAIELYSRVNERITQVEKLADERVDHIRRAFRQQLSNAITRLSSIYQADMERRIKQLQKDKLGDAAVLLDTYHELQQKNQRNESLITMLRSQLVEAMTKPPPIIEEKEDEDRQGSSPTPGNNNEEELEELRDEIDNLETKLEQLTEKLDVKDEHISELKMDTANLKDALEREKITVQQLRHENDELKNSHDQDKHASKRQEFSISPMDSNKDKGEVTSWDGSRLQSDKSFNHFSPESPIAPSPGKFSAGSTSSLQGQVFVEMGMPSAQQGLSSNHNSQTLHLHSVANFENKSFNNDVTLQARQLGQSTKATSAAGQRSHLVSADSGYHGNVGLEKQRLEMEKAMEMKMKQVADEMSASAEGNLKSIQKSEQNKIQLLVNQNMKLEQELADARAIHSHNSKEQQDKEVKVFREEKMSSEITRLKKEIDRVHQSWGKKFSILQNSLHALKDESYVRQSLQRQAAALHHAAISYAVDTPLGIRPTKQAPRKPPLPDIPKSGKSGDYYSYTLSGHSNRLQSSVDENQVVFETDAPDIPTDIEPLPQPPVRPFSMVEEETSRPSTSHVVVLPSA